MKNIIVLLSLLLFTYSIYAQGLCKLKIDTSELVGEREYRRGHKLSEDEVRNLYRYGYNWSKEKRRGSHCYETTRKENSRIFSCKITNNKIFNTLIPEAEVRYEMYKGGRLYIDYDDLKVVYNGKYYSIYNGEFTNLLLNDMGKLGKISPKDIIRLALEFHYWMDNVNIEIFEYKETIYEGNQYTIYINGKVKINNIIYKLKSGFRVEDKSILSIELFKNDGTIHTIWMQQPKKENYKTGAEKKWWKFNRK